MADKSSDDSYWVKRADAARRFTLPIIGAMILANSAHGIYEISSLRDAVEASTKLTCHSNVTLHLKKSRYTISYVADEAGNQFGFCYGFECSYKGWGSDEGKQARICYAGGVLVSAEVEGVPRLTRDDRLTDMNNRIWLNTMMVAVGLVCLGISAYLERKTLRSFLRSHGNR